ncbi:lipase [Aureibaculum marinum]|uniref:Lipase n=1 Tax=Aureibaculum marinum TaxID=2487930 RepID=A0A3N4NB57_9FLAO|nr:carboxylesterase family protein [Aureibaculum marinum]RPD90696.1 lipase [Aureibaculum marinum]
MRTIVALLTFLFFCTSYAQTKTTYTYAIKGTDTLMLDVYLPKKSKTTDAFPVLLWMHGGGFGGGTRDNPSEQKLAEYVTKHKVVGVSISYRLTRKGTLTGFGCDCPKEEKNNTFKAAVEDYMDAALFLVKNKEKFKIDSSKIIAGGSSAGAEAILNAVFMREHFIQDLEKYKTVQFAGVFSLAGAVVNANYITKDNSIPTVLFHGTDDNLVPFGTAPHHYCDTNKPGYFMLDGSNTIIRKLNELETSYYFYVVKGGMHEMAGIPFYDLDNVLNFFKKTILDGETIQIKKIKSKI